LIGWILLAVLIPVGVSGVVLLVLRERRPRPTSASHPDLTSPGPWLALLNELSTIESRERTAPALALRSAEAMVRGLGAECVAIVELGLDGSLTLLGQSPTAASGERILTAARGCLEGRDDPARGPGANAPGVISVPLHHASRCVGVLVVLGLPGHGKGAAVRSSLMFVAEWLATAIQACESALREAERSVQLSVVNQIGKIAASKRSPADLLETTVRLLAHRFGYDHVCFALLAPLGGEILSWAEAGVCKETVVEGPEAFERSGSAFHRAASTGATVVLQDTREVAGYVDIRSGVTRSEIAVPILSAGEVIAVLSVASATERALGSDDARALERIRGWLAVAITNSLYVEELNRANLDALRAREQAEAERCRLEITFRSIPEAVLVLDARQRVVLLNERAEDLLACAEETVRGRCILDLLPSDRFRALLLSAMEAPGRIVRGEIDLMAHDGSTRRHYQVCIDTELLSSEIETGTMVILRDVTRDRELEVLKSEFLANVSHELRTPLTSVIGFSQLLGDEELGEINEVQKECVERIINQGRHLLSIINALLDLSRLKAKKTALELESVSLQDLVEETMANLVSLSDEKEITVTSRLPADLPRARIDRGKISQVLINLLNNAIKFTQTGGVVWVDGAASGGMLDLSISDNGPGIPAEHLDFVFDRFHRVGNFPGGISSGTGLGLTIVKELVELHEGGRVDVESRLGIGSRFSFRVPADQGPRRHGPLRLGHLPLEGHELVALLKERSPYSEELTLDIRCQRSVLDLALDCRGGGLDAVVLPLPEGLRLVAGGLDLVAVAVIARGDGCLLTRRLRTVRDLAEGGIVGVPGLGSNEELLLSRCLRRAGVSREKLRCETFRWEDGLLALEEGRIDAVALPEPFARRARDRGARVLGRMEEELPGFPSAALFVRRPILEARRDEIVRLLARLHRLRKEEGTGHGDLGLSVVELQGVLTLLHQLGALLELRGIDLSPVIDEGPLLAARCPRSEIPGRSEPSWWESPDLTAELHGGEDAAWRRPSGRRHVLLVVDDRPEVLSLVKVKFRKHFDVLTGTNGREGVEVARGEKRPDLILMDVMMPEMDGLQATRLLKADPRTRDIPVWAFTAKVMTEDFDEARAAGCSDVVTKPFDPGRLLDKVKRFLAERDAQSAGSAWDVLGAAEDGPVLS